MMNLKTKSLIVAAVTATPLFFWSGGAAAGAPALTPLELLGKHVFFDKISKPEDEQACASCHNPAKGWILPDSAINKTTVVAPGAKQKRHGSIKTPSNAYASFSPPFRSGNFGPIPPWEGGNFWDGRAEGCGATSGPCPAALPAGVVSQTITAEDLPLSKQPPAALEGSPNDYTKYLGPTADQALNPFPNKVEQNIRERRVCKTVQDAKYSYLYQKAFGEAINCKAQPANKPPYLTTYRRIAVALAAWQGSGDVNSFTSKRDKALKNDGDGKFPLDGLTEQENLGHDLFYGITSTLNPTGKSARCNFCHNGFENDEGAWIVPPPAGPNAGRGEEPRQLYSDNRYHHIGVPFNREIPDVVKGEKTGLAAHVVTDVPLVGEFRTPTLRNVAKGLSKNFVKAYTHNGWFKSLESIVHFYNTRDVLQKCEDLKIDNATEKEALKHNCWPASEFPDPAGFVVGNLGLSHGIGPDAVPNSEEAALVAYMKTLTDDYTPTKPK